MLTVQQAIQLIEEELIKIPLSREPKGLYAPISYTLEGGGQRIRPLLTLLSGALFTTQIEPCIKPAIGLEVFHNFTLLHDDIMDKAPIRRGRPTVHLEWDENTAILSGDVMQILAYEYLCTSPAQYLGRILEVFNQTAREVCEGQQYDMDFENRKNVPVSDYLEMIRLKTAVLIAASTQIGALIGGAGKEDVERMYQFGINLGLAFQLQDDYLDSFGSEEKFGKTIGGDIVANKKTMLYITALERANAKEKQELESLYSGTSQDNDEKIDAAR